MSELETPEQVVNSPSQETTQTKAKKVKGGADPRDENFALQYDKTTFSKAEGEAGMSELYQLISVMFGMYAFIIHGKWACWAAAFFFYTSAINSKSDNRLQQVFTGFSIIMISFVNNYLTPHHKALQAQQAAMAAND